jgi:hypothetical protein
MIDQPDYYTKPDHGHDANSEMKPALQIGIVLGSMLISALSAYLLGVV